MTNSQKKQIKTMRLQGMSYSAIGKVMGLSENTVHSHCRRNGLAGDCTKVFQCKQCGELNRIIPKRKPKKFCSDACRMAWWNSHPECVNRKAMHDFSCVACGKVFTSYGNRVRKYCSHACYIADRYGEKEHE